jgi:hypothetical protein
LANGNWTYSRYSNADFSRDGYLEIYLESQNNKTITNNAPPKIYYKVCADTLKNCRLDEAVQAPPITNFSQITTGVAVGDHGLKIQLPHKFAESGCTNAADCHYQFIIYNDGSDYKTISMMVQASLTNPGDIYLTRKYANELLSGRYFYYEISDKLNPNDMPYLQSLTVKLQTYRGDADLFVSTVS